VMTQAVVQLVEAVVRFALTIAVALVRSLVHAVRSSRSMSPAGVLVTLLVILVVIAALRSCGS
jgi:hypothetical protein